MTRSLSPRALLAPSPARRQTTQCLRVLAVTFLVAGGLAGCSSDTGGSDAGDAEPYEAPVVVVNCDREVRVEAPVERAVAVNQPAVELLLALGLGDRIASYAMSDDDVLPELEEEREGVEAFDTEFPSFETVLDVEPDLVYTTFDYTFTDEGIAGRDRFEELGVPTYQSPSECSGQEAEQTRALTLEDQWAEIEEVATLFGVRERGDELVSELSARAEEATVDLGAENVTMAWWYAATPAPYMAGCCGAPGLMTRAVGATNAFEDAEQYWPEIGWESVLERDPTVLVLADLGRGGDGDSAAEKIEFLESDPVASRLTAVQEQRYIVLDGTTMDPSIRNVTGIEQLAQGLRDLGLVE
ncbi:ABC transporter substrate-binding protein [Nocardioides zeae]|uniref:ABC transporter substrate-binding protein n=1 Tax=Nocardioides imazamoxiresistens TaxID=3231893 RepID=A0ABU3Q0A6_9ACTN|nr:ABC transporter substrate-binding protein [Nocardioides zeae]MDT9594953.1 ABC transporter substrate-binding protein [Nocardioides zeae]